MKRRSAWNINIERLIIVLAGLRVVVLSGLGGGTRRRTKLKIKVMEWWQKMVFPVRRALCSVTARVKARKDGAGLVKQLHDDIQTCGYEDVQIMWEMLKRTESELVISRQMTNKRKVQWFWRNFACSNVDASVFSTKNRTQ